MTKWEIKLLTNQSKNIARIVEVGNNSSMIVNEGGGLVKASAFDYFNNWGRRTLGLQVCSWIMTYTRAFYSTVITAIL